MVFDPSVKWPLSEVPGNVIPLVSYIYVNAVLINVDCASSSCFKLCIEWLES